MQVQGQAVLVVLFQAVSCLADTSGLAPLLGDGSSVDWFFAYKLNTKNFPECSTTRECIFGGEVEAYSTGYGLQYLLASGVGGKTSPLALHTDCLGSGDDPVAKTFAQIFDGTATNYVIWNDQFYGDPTPKISPSCGSDCDAPWGHSKGAMAWGADGAGFVLQVSTPDWPGNGDKSTKRAHEGNTLGCIRDDDAKVAQHFFALRLASTADTKAVLEALGRASVATDPANEQLVKLSDGPAELATLAKSLGKVDDSTGAYKATLSVGSVTLMAKPHSVLVPPWQLVSSIVQQPLRVATWFATPKILSAKAGRPGCWDAGLAEPKEVQTALSGQWGGKVMGMKGSSSPDGNHAKIGHSLGGSLSIFGDMNQEGFYAPSDGPCKAHQGGRGGLFFALEDEIMHSGMLKLLTGDTAPYYGGGPSPGPSPAPSPSPHDDPCGGADTRSSTCKASSAKGCVYVHAKDASACGVSAYGCYSKANLSSGCPEGSSPSPGPSPSPPSPPTPPAPHSDPCGGADTRSSTCKASSAKGCVYVFAKDARACGISAYGCYSKTELSEGCPEKTGIFMV